MLDLFQKHYFYELERRDEINRSVALTITILTASAGVVLFNSQFLGVQGRLQTWLLCVQIFGIVLLANSIIRVVEMTGRTYLYMSDMDDVWASLEKLKEHEDEKLAFSQATQWFGEDCAKHYADCSAHNFEINNGKASLLLNANQMGMYSLLTGLLVGLIGILFGLLS